MSTNERSYCRYLYCNYKYLGLTIIQEKCEDNFLTVIQKSVRTMTAEQVLKKYIDFAAMDVESPALEAKAEALIETVEEFFTRPNDLELEERTLDFVRELHWELSGHLDSFTHDRPGAVVVEQVMLRSSGSTVHFSHFGGAVRSYVWFMYMTIMQAKVKAILRCPGCGHIFIRTKGRRLTCSDRCRTRKCAANRTPEQKELLRKKRSKRYRK